MRPIGFKIEKISAEKFKDPDENGINLKTNFNLGNPSKEEAAASDKTTVFGFEFTYSIDYDSYALVEFKGKVFLSVDKELAKELEKENPVISKELKAIILNYSLFKTHAESLHLEEKLGLPFHIPSPIVSEKE